MTGFSVDWLSLREPADQAARNTHVLDACAGYFAGQSSLLAADLGAGTGASVRALATVLPAGHSWCLIDHDEANLEAAKARHPDVRIQVSDLDARPDAWPASTGLVTISALLDLASAGWIERLVAALARDRLPLLVMMTVDGSVEIAPPHPLDGRIIKAREQHMQRNKGLGGAAAGGAAARLLEESLARAGYRTVTGDSPWLLVAGTLRDLMLDGFQRNAEEIGGFTAAELAGWRARVPDLLTVGHRDVFAWPA